MITIVYFHGFASIGKNDKYNELRITFPEYQILTLNLTFDPIENIKKINELLEQQYNNTNKLIFVGTSLGGFYANYYAQYFDCECYLINPCVKPHEKFIDNVDKEIINYYTKEKISVTIEHLNEYKKMFEKTMNNINGNLINLFLGGQDNVTPYKEIDLVLPFVKNRIYVENGDHRFSDYFYKVIEQIKKDNK